MKKDNLNLGITLGILVPIIIAVLLYFLKFSYYPASDFISTVRSESRLITFFAAWCLVANIALFTLFINTNKYRTGKGVFIVTIVYGIGFLLLKLL